ncbi:Gfo/Idh/MocA family protein [Marinimicrobium sp. ABcell2]|uniref:Gfo/Idh/MocA family protein n=1 Tax=Marinimicrobium sp. ABcell2 TaxID=3069751 RepID=UPI0027B6FC28|nr:Gfo/Idh/MocA family oxidoreductase [Marinimicrobium sp. ABcell2]MDQ2077095.1 Gfo/Idh/MocA family oxidoreductase [Marinimicrobium sp. ABcell2]
MDPYLLSRRRLLKQLGLSATVASTGLSAHVLASKPNRKLGVALVGLGFYSTDWLAPALQLTKHCELRGIVTGSPEKIPEWQEKYGIKDKNVYNYENMHTVADNPDIDIIYVVTPTSTHREFSLIAANAGKHVWCEKPMAMDEKECQDIIDACRKNKVKLTIGYRLQHEPNTQAIMTFADTKPFGAIKDLNVVAAYQGSSWPDNHWKTRWDMGGGAMYDMGVYPINGARYATGQEPIAIEARHEVTHPEIFTAGDSTTHFTLEFPNGVEATCMTSMVKPGNKLEVNCADGWYRLEPMSELNEVRGKTSAGHKLNKEIPSQQALQMDNDALAIINDTAVIVPGEEGLRDIRVVRGAFESVRQNKRITL